MRFVGVSEMRHGLFYSLYWGVRPRCRAVGDGASPNNTFETDHKTSFAGLVAAQLLRSAAVIMGLAE